MSALELRAEGRLRELDDATRRALLDRGAGGDGADGDLATAVRRLMDAVRTRGDAALREMTERFDGVRLDALEVPREAWEEALRRLDGGVRAALERAAANLRAFHQAQLPARVSVEVEPGVTVSRVSVPLERVGVYAPGGRAAYPSSVLMGVVPARAAGVEEVVLCSPPGPDGRPPDAVLAACALGGAHRLFALGGAGAVAALAYGTESVPAVDAVVGPGNRWVTEAKRQIAGRVRIDAPAGPSEVLVVADDSADPAWVALELLAQAEHDPDACALLLTDAPALAKAVRDELEARVPRAPRADIIRAALREGGALLVAETLDEAFAFAGAYAPEHLSIMTRSANIDAGRVRTAGTVFVGAAASVAFGDYLTGANHVLPTGGRGRSFSGLSVEHFLRSYTVQTVSPEGAAALADDTALLATAEGLPAHAEAAGARRRA